MKTTKIAFKVAGETVRIEARVAQATEDKLVLVCDSLDDAFRVAFCYQLNRVVRIEKGDLGVVVIVEKVP